MEKSAKRELTFKILYSGQINKEMNDEELQIYRTMHDHCFSDGTARDERHQPDISFPCKDTGSEYPREASSICHGRRGRQYLVDRQAVLHRRMRIHEGLYCRD